MPNSSRQSPGKQRKNRDNEPFFIGYLPMPAVLKRFYWVFALALMAVCAGLGYGLASMQKSAGPASWHTESPIIIHGWLTAAPYPTLHRFAGAAQVESILLVRQGKHAAQAADFDRRWVSVRGYHIQRGDWRMLELDGGNAILPATAAEASATARIRAAISVKNLGEIALNGEIVDSKCMLGVMKPGIGKVHKACAEVCLLGGIPPILLAQDANARRFGYLLVDAEGGSAAVQLAKFAAEPVAVRGRLQQRGNWFFIQLARAGVRRL